MRAFWSVVALQLRAAARSKAVAMLLLASLAWMFAAPRIVAGDGTADGALQMFVRYSLWGVFALVLVCLAASGAGSLSADRAARRLQLALVRPVSRFAVALGRVVALVAVGAAVLAACSAVALWRVGATRPCSHVLRPVMESPRAEAERAYKFYMSSPDTPEEIKKADRASVVALLERKAFDRYVTVATNSVARWKFDASGVRRGDGLAVRIKFSSSFGMRQDFAGRFTLGALSGSVSNVTQSVLVVPLVGADGALDAGACELRFENTGRDSVMLRPRRDIAIVHSSPSDTFAANLALAFVVMISMLATVVSFAVFLGAGLGRSPAVFTVTATLLLAVASPAVVEDYDDQLEKSSRDRVGLAIARFAGVATRPLGSFDPVGTIADRECVELRDVARAVALELVAIPLVLAFLSALVMPLKQEGME